MKDPRSILREKEQDLERVRREIQALLTVIPLLVDDPPTSDVVHEVLLASSRAPVNLPEDDMAQLEIYYTFVRHLRMSERAIPRVLSGDDLCRSPGGSDPGEQKILRSACSDSRSAGPLFVALAPHMYNLADQFFGSQSFQNSQNQGSPIHFPRPQFPA